MWQKVKNVYHLLVAILANIYYGFPSRRLVIIGVTGTDGKTTTTSLVYHILKEAGYKVSIISTVSAIIHGKAYDTGFHVTNPSSFPLQKFLSEAVKKGDTHLVLEVTSHGLDQNRVWGIPFAIGVLTNITHEHLDYHKTYSEYLQAKMKLLNSAKVAVINRDDNSFHKVKYFLKKNKRVITYGQKNADFSLDSIKMPANINTLYNKYNGTAAGIVAREFGINKKIIEKALKTFIFPKGRTEMVYEKDFNVMIDFAHTPNAFKQLLSSLSEKTKGRLIHVFGSAGARDVSKRPLMGKIASDYDDILIITSEDPRKENPKKIIADIEKGVRSEKKAQTYTIIDRKSAIERAIFLAQKGDFVIITGKAHENSMNYGKGEEPWDEFKVVEKALQEKTKSNN
ncbi:MAG TPA: UDP-N-acetylmuramoyl-L-alanyl-D-glutamate--2,6-diaminopimelate ligase [Patescibacteria group bacterium]